MAWLSDFVLDLRSKLPADVRTERINEMSKVAFPGLLAIELVTWVFEGPCRASFFFRFWLGEFFNRMERYGHYLTDAEKVGLQEACVAWLGLTTNCCDE